MDQAKKHLSRRTFLKSSAIGAASLATTGLLASCAPAAKTASTLPAKWDKEADVVVVGYGGAGAITAIAAREAGASVIVLEKRAIPGGATAICGGVYYAANTSVQKANGIEDSADKMYQHYINAGMGFNDPKQARLAADHSAANVEKLIALGGSFPAAPTVSGAEYNVGSEPIARVHAIQYGDKTGGGAFFAVLADAAKAKGAEILMETPALDLVVNDKGEVVGVKAGKVGAEIYVKAKKGVVLTTGGFTRSEQMLYNYSMQGHYCQPLGTPDLTGDGHLMALKLGADVTNMSEILGIPGLTLPGATSATYALWTFNPTLPAILVNNKGQRFVDEGAFYDWKNTELLKQPDKFAYSVFDSKMLPKAAGAIVIGWTPDLEKEVSEGQIVKAASIAELAEKINIPAASLEAGIAKWNDTVKAGKDADFGRALGLEAIDTAPFYAFKTFPTMFDTSGGLKINENAQIVNLEGNVIPRLYGAGQVSGGVIGEHYPGSGTALNALMTFGQIAGKHAAGLTAWA